MAHYTTEIRSIVEQLNNDHSFVPSETDPINAIDQRIENARPYIFSFSYPINQADKQRFEHNFIRHFYTREIGFETYTLWRLKLADELNMIIPKYNKLWEEATKYVDKDLLDNADYRVIREYDGTKILTGTEVLDGRRTDNTQRAQDLTRTDDLTQADLDTTTLTRDRDFVRAYSDTPQSNMENLLDEKYLTNLTHEYESGSRDLTNKNASTRNTGTQRNAGTVANTGYVDTDNTTTKNERATDEQDETTRHVGKTGGMTYAEALLKARETYINIDLMLCNDLRDLFMLIW